MSGFADALPDLLIIKQKLKQYMSKASKPLEPSDILIEHFPDRSIRRLIQDPEYVRGLVEIIAPELVGLLD